MQKKSKKNVSLLKKTYPIILVISSLMMGIVYAAVNNVMLDIRGKATAMKQEGIYITSVKYSEGSNVDKNQSSIKSTYQTMMNSSIQLSSSDPSSYITYTVTVYNDTDMSYSFKGTNYEEDFYSNDNITFELTNIEIDDQIQSKGFLTFDITFKYKDGVVPSSSTNELNSYLNFLFLHPVKYISSTGTQYINTEVNVNENTTLDMVISMNDINRTQAVYGTRTSMDDGVYHNLFFYENHLRWDENGTQIVMSDVNYNEGKKIHFFTDSKKITISTNGTTVQYDNPPISWELDSSAYIFGENQQLSADTRYALMKLYYLKMYDNGVLVRDFIPVLDKDKTPCLYDLVSNKCFYNAGNGEFEYSETFEVLEYLESSGTQYIDINIKPESTTSVEFVMSLNEQYSGTQSIFGSRIDQIKSTFNIFWYRNSLRWDYNDSITFPNTNPLITKPTLVKASSSFVQLNEDITEFENTKPFSSDYNLYLFSINNSGKAIYPSEGMKLYFFKIYKEEEVIANFIPVKDENGIACLYDLISKSYFYNTGTGEFLYN